MAQSVSQTLSPLDVMSHIISRPPTPETAKDVSRWYKWEYMTLNFGEYVGKPAANIDAHKSFLSYFFAEGWSVDAVLSSGEDGVWQSVASSTSTNEGEAQTTSNGTSTSSGNSSATSEAHSRGYSTESGQYVSGNSSGASSGTNESVGTATSQGTNTTTATATVESTTEGGPYWYAYSRIRLKRRKLDPEVVLADMIGSFTNAYNEGRTINNSRYDELVALYAIMLTHTEAEANDVPITTLTPEDFTALGDQLASKFEQTVTVSPATIASLLSDAKEKIRAATSTLRTYANSIPQSWLDSRTAEINRQFDTKIAQAKATMIANGTYNGTTWPNVESGYERDRQYAINNLADGIVTLKVDTYGKAATITADSETKLAEIAAKVAGAQTEMADAQAKVAQVRSGLMESAVRVVDAVNKQRIGLTELRNTVAKWMFDFMERREDDYPGLDQLLTVADKLGYGEGISGSTTPNS